MEHFVKNKKGGLLMSKLTFEQEFEVIQQFVKGVVELWEKIKSRLVDFFKNFIDQLPKKAEAIYGNAQTILKHAAHNQKTMASWHVPVDTTRPGQVINSKPRNIVRKVIR
jgi:hypothetical protein